MGDPVVTIERRGEHTAIVRIDRPKALNALNPQVIDELGVAVERLREGGVRHLVVTGGGEKAFVAGADIAAMKDLSPGEAAFFARRGQRVLDALSHFPGVVVAAVGGFALGGGMELAMACDLIIAAENARFGQPEVNLGVIPGFGGTQRLVRAVGAQRARELIFTGRMIDAAEAQRIGLVLEVVPVGQALDRALTLIAEVEKKGPMAVRLAKEATRLPEEAGMEDGLQGEAELFGRCFAAADQKEGMAAFLEKRTPRFTGA
jgi:enoyl-CoA hydratase